MYSYSPLYLYLFSLLILIGCTNTKPSYKDTLTVPYGLNPETPPKTQLEAIATVEIEQLESSLEAVDSTRQDHFYQVHGLPFSGWAKQDFLEGHQRTRHYKIEQGWVNWQIGYFDNGLPDCDFHALNGKDHGNQRMWARDGTP